jgi:hypothetical protein
MNTISDHAVIDYKYRQLKMLLWQAAVHEKNGKEQEASKIKAWVAGFLSANRSSNEI